MHPWLSRLRHDLVKRAVWPARDLRDATRAPGPADLLHLRAGLLDLRGDDGGEVTAAGLWQRLRAEAPGLPAGVLDAFGAAVAEAQRAVTALAGDPGSWPEALAAVLRIESAFDDLARSLEWE